jgi:hypothetical protein
MRCASRMSNGMIVALFPCIAHSLVSSKRQTRYASKASWRVRTAVLCIRKSNLKLIAISRTRHWKGAFLINSLVNFWYLQFCKGQRSQGGNGEASSRHPSCMLSLAPPLLQGAFVGPFPQLTCVHFAYIWPLLIVDNVVYLVFLCMLFAVGCCALPNKKEDASHPTLNHLVTDPTTATEAEWLYRHSKYLRSGVRDPTKRNR